MPTTSRKSDQQERHRPAEAKRSRRPTSETTLLIGVVQALARAKTFTAPAAVRTGMRGSRTSHSPDALEERIAKATAAEVEKWGRVLERIAKLEAKEDKIDGRALSAPNSPPSTTKMVYAPDQSSKSHAIIRIPVSPQDSLPLSYPLISRAISPGPARAKQLLWGSMMGKARRMIDSVDTPVDIVIDPTTLRRIGREEIRNSKDNVVMTLLSKDSDGAPMKVVFDRAIGSKAGMERCKP
ncbi:hypothetical protein F4679DRAFT_582900 [Xylaria curta]|nr:hypothetical protein F4679DRAFT_582900 [Xylaria curta]